MEINLFHATIVAEDVQFWVLCMISCKYEALEVWCHFVSIGTKYILDSE